ncbi:Lymphocyte expansion molecule [Manis javanica]|nr:Lymphocyte expansion molecule [Manis javanica]
MSHVGPGTYGCKETCFIKKKLKKEVGTGWARAQEATRLTQLPHVQYQAIMRERQLQVRPLGPRSSLPQSTAFSVRPGPEGKARAWLLRIQRLLRTSATETMQHPGAAQLRGDSLLRTHGELLSRPWKWWREGQPVHEAGGEGLEPVSLQGPHVQDDQQATPLAPQKKKPKELMSFKSFMEELNSRHNKKRGVFSKASRNSETPTERIYWATLSQCPRKQATSGPGMWLPPEQKCKQVNQPPFLLSSKQTGIKAYQIILGSWCTFYWVLMITQKVHEFQVNSSMNCHKMELLMQPPTRALKSTCPAPEELPTPIPLDNIHLPWSPCIPIIQGSFA